MSRSYAVLIGLLLALAVLPAPAARAWSYKEHTQFARLAIERLIADPSTPPAMVEWLKQQGGDLLDEAGEKEYFLHTAVGMHADQFKGVIRYATKPDDYQSDKTILEPFNAPERLMHFIDLEIFVSGDQKREYRPDLSGKPPIENFPHDMKDPRYAQSGMLPFRVEYCYGKLIESIKAKRMTDADAASAGTAKIGNEPDSAVRWAGYLAHYLSDNTQPQHATIDYKSATYFPVLRKAPNVHSEVEYRMADDDKHEHPEMRAEYWPLFEAQLKDPAVPAEVDDKDLFRATLQVSESSYDALPMIGEAAAKAVIKVPGEKPDDVDTEAFFHYTGQVRGKTMTVMQMKAVQTAWAVKRVQKVLRQAWEDAAK